MRVFAGPNGSGKSSIIKSILNTEVKKGKNLISVFILMQMILLLSSVKTDATSPITLSNPQKLKYLI